MNNVLREYILAVLAAVVFFSIVIGAVVSNQAKTQQKKANIQACSGSGGFINSVCKYKSGGGRKRSGISLPSEPFRGIDTGIPY